MAEKINEESESERLGRVFKGNIESGKILGRAEMALKASDMLNGKIPEIIEMISNPTEKIKVQAAMRQLSVEILRAGIKLH